jgi:hypothetical protein
VKAYGASNVRSFTFILMSVSMDHGCVVVTSWGGRGVVVDKNGGCCTYVLTPRNSYVHTRAHVHTKLLLSTVVTLLRGHWDVVVLIGVLSVP